MSTDSEWHSSTRGKPLGASGRVRAINRTVNRVVAQPLTEGIGEIVETLSELKRELRTEQEGYLHTLRVNAKKNAAARGGSKKAGVRTPTNVSQINTIHRREELDHTLPLKYGMEPSKSGPDVLTSTSKTEETLLGHIERKQRALEESKRELQRSLDETRRMEQRFEEERRLLQSAEKLEREQNRPNKEYWQPFGSAEGQQQHQSYVHEAKEETRPNHGPNGEFEQSGAQLWRRAPSSTVVLAGTPRSHPTKRAAGMSSLEKRGKNYPAGRSHRLSTHPNHPPSFAPEQATEEVDTRAVLRALPASKKTVLDLFRSYDTHCTGAVNSNEFATGLIQAGLNLSIPQIAGLIKKLDRENRGEVRYINLIEAGEEAFRHPDSSTDPLPQRMFDPPPAPQPREVYVPIPPFDTNDEDVTKARKNRNRQSCALAILRTADRAVRNPDGSFNHDKARQMPEYYRQLHAEYTPTGSPNEYFPRPIGFVEKPYSASLGPSNIVENPIVHNPELRASNTEGWGGDADGPSNPRPKTGEFGRDYSSSVLDPSSTAGAGLKSISERVQHEPARFVAMMRKLDRDGDQRVSHKELLHGLDSLGVNIPTWRAKALIQALDRHGTGTVKYEEVGGLLSEYAKQGKEARAVVDAKYDSLVPESRPSPFTPGFVPSNEVRLHNQPTWAPSNSIGNNVEEWTRSRRIEKEWEERQKQEQLLYQQQSHERAIEQERALEQEQAYDPPAHSERQHAPHETYFEHMQHSPLPETEHVARQDQPAGGWVEESQQESKTQSSQPAAQQRPQQAHYPNLYRTSDEIARMNAKASGGGAAGSAGAAPLQEQSSHPGGDETPQYSQVGTELPVLPVEYPQSKKPSSKARARTPAPQQRSRSRSSSISSVRSQTPSLRGGRGENGLPERSFSRSSSRRGSFSQAPRLEQISTNGKYLHTSRGEPGTPSGGKGAAGGGRMWTSNAGDYWPDERQSDYGSESGRQSRARTPSQAGTPTAARRSASVSALDGRDSHQPRSTVEVEQYGSSSDAELFKILRLAIAPPLSAAARAARSVGNRGPPVQQQQQQQQNASPDPFPVHHARSATPAPPTPSSGRSRSNSFDISSTSSAPIHHDSRTGQAYESRSIQPHAYGLNFGAWSDRRARDLMGSGWSLG